MLCSVPDVLSSIYSELDSTAGEEKEAIFMASLSCGQIPVFLNPEMIVSGLLALYHACETKELNWSLVPTDPGFLAKYAWHSDDQCRLRGPKKLTSSGCVA